MNERAPILLVAAALLVGAAAIWASSSLLDTMHAAQAALDVSENTRADVTRAIERDAHDQRSHSPSVQKAPSEGPAQGGDEELLSPDQALATSRQESGGANDDQAPGREDPIVDLQSENPLRLADSLLETAQHGALEAIEIDASAPGDSVPAEVLLTAAEGPVNATSTDEGTPLELGAPLPDAVETIAAEEALGVNVGTGAPEAAPLLTSPGDGDVVSDTAIAPDGHDASAPSDPSIPAMQVAPPVEVIDGDPEADDASPLRLPPVVDNRVQHPVETTAREKLNQDRPRRLVRQPTPAAPPLPGEDTRSDAADDQDAATVADLIALQDGDGDTQQSGGLDDDQTIGEEPEPTNTELQFLRRQSILLDPGEYQIDITFQYLLDEIDFAAIQLDGNLIQIGEARRRQRLLLVPFEFRLGMTPTTQVFINVPIGWANGEFIFNGVDEFSNSGGVGDISMGVTRQLMEGTDHFPDILANFAFTIPSGDSNFATSLAIPGSTLGQGFWGVVVGLSAIQQYDPIVLFYGVGYRHRFENDFGNGIEVDPGKQIFYRFGAGFALNSRVTLSGSFFGSYITEDFVNDVRVAGTIREPMSVRLAATISKDKKGCGHCSVKTVEPFVNFGITEDAVDTLFGISWTH